MNINQIKPMPGKILVKKLPDETTTKSGIILPKDTPVNKRHEYVEVIRVGKMDSLRTSYISNVSPGDKCIVLGKGIYDTVPLEDEIYYIIAPVDIVAVLE